MASTVSVLGLLTAVFGVVSGLSARRQAEISFRLEGVSLDEVSERGKEQAARRNRLVSLVVTLFGIGMMLVGIL